MLLPSWHGPRRARSWFRTIVAYKRGTCGSVPVPLLALLAGLPLERADYARDPRHRRFRFAAADGADPKGGERGFGALGGDRGGRRAAWPPMPGRSKSAGPFYLVWLDPERSDIGREQWPYSLSSLTAVEPPVQRWPQIAVDPDLRRTIRRGAAGGVHRPMPAVPPHAGWGRGRDGSRSRPAQKPDRIHDAGLASWLR